MRLLLELSSILFLLACAPTGATIATPTSPPAIMTATPTPLPADAIDLNCDGRHERLVQTTSGSAVTGVAVESPYASGQRHPVYSAPGAEVAVIEKPEALALNGCEQLIFIPVRFSGSGSILQLLIFRWDGAATNKVFDETAQHGRWSAEGKWVTLTGPVYLYNEPNCCPCAFQDRMYAWDWQRFSLTGDNLRPADPLPPPSICTGTPVPTPPRR